MKRISVVVPMYNEAAHIVRTLKSVWAAAGAAGLECQLIVVDNGSTDHGPVLAREFGATVLSFPGLPIGALRNRGAAVADGDWLGFLDADIEVPADWFLLWQQVHQAHSADVLALDCDTPTIAPWYARAWQRRSMAGNPRPRALKWLPTPNLCMERALFERIGGFDESLRTGEDKELGLRLNQAGARQVSLAQPAMLHWGYEGSWREWVGKEYWRQGSHVQMLNTQGLSLRLLRFPMLCIMTCLLSLLVLLSLMIGQPLAAAGLFACSLPAPLVMAARQSVRHRAAFFSLQLWLLHWVRLHVGGAAFILNFLNRTAVRPERG